MNMNDLVAEGFCRVLGPGRVHGSVRAANDDTLASHAHHRKATILSADKDYFRYPASYTQYADYSIKGGMLELTPHRYSGLAPGSPRALQEMGAGALPLLSPPPPIVDMALRSGLEGPGQADGGGGLSAPRIHPFAHDLVPPPRSYWRGVPTPLIRALGSNPHVTCTPLRRALYARLWEAPGDEHSVREVFPAWGEGGFHWHEARVTPLRAGVEEFEKWDALLAEEGRAFAELFPEEAAGRRPAGVSAGLWNNHVWGCKALVYQLCAVAQDRPLLDLLQRDPVAWATNFSTFPQIRGGGGGGGGGRVEGRGAGNSQGKVRRAGGAGPAGGGQGGGRG
jgi:hypothetical protein